MLTFPTQRHLSKEIFVTKKWFLLVNLFTTSFNRSHQEADICKGKKLNSLNFESIFNF